MSVIQLPAQEAMHLQGGAHHSGPQMSHSEGKEVKTDDFQGPRL